MNHHEHHENHNHEMHNHVNDECCWGGCCEDDAKLERAYRIGYILQWVLLWGAFLCSLLTLLFLPKIIRREVTAEQALKAGWYENYMRLNKEIYDTPEYKEITKQNIDMIIQQQKAQMQMYKQQLQEGATNPDMPMTPDGASEENAPAEQNTATGTLPGTGN